MMNKREKVNKILKNAQPEIKSALKRWFKLPKEERNDQVLLYWLLGTGTPAYKMSKEKSNYTDQASGEHMCRNCEFMYREVATGKNICSQITGKIKPEGWCKLHELIKGD